MLQKSVLLILLLSFLSCSSEVKKLQELDLMSEGIPLKIKAPSEAIVKTKDLGVFKDITIRKDDFYIQITSSEALNKNVSERKDEELKSVKALRNFSKIIEENEDGFIFEKTVGDSSYYDFRHIKIQGENEFLSQSGLIGKFSLANVKLMYKALK